MKGGRGLSGLSGMTSMAAPARKKAAQAVPTIVFHGDRDHTVQHSNGVEIARQASDAHASGPARIPLGTSQRRATSPSGRSYTRAVHADDSGQPFVESILGAVLHTGYHGGAVACNMLTEQPLVSTILSPVSVGIFVGGGLYLRDAEVRRIMPLVRR